ncbi:hypothetical protein L198_01025 [Cryptococcus wingfieldii CBS 7118]|uniref:Uncharacterized protein n=1 Tax=Cryptococcus wingfieldii CBS 7118 TaxID=1295528 RepID=A0A1E3K347_9TREE|nr:hypothetical protein L198_01025 [Cryptococcus wingfieldii CBS 7118]ODO07446.1 hypothetical protein L198_01025 [Cryptococcus wingfieldii CBS 7118]
MSEKRDSMVGNKESWAAVDLSHSQAQAKKKQWYHKVIPGTVYTRILLATIITETVIDLTIEATILYRFNEEVKSTSSTDLELENKRRLPIYLIIFGLAHLWQLVLVSIAIRMKNTVQVIAVTAFNFAFLGYAIIQIYELRKILGGTSLSEGLKGNDTGSTLMTIPLNVLTALIIAVVAVSSVGLLVLSVLLRREFGRVSRNWQRYRFLGADLMIREYYFKFQIFECICYFGAFFCAGFGIQFIWLVLNPSDVEYIITWIAFPLLIIFLVIGRYAAKYENVYFMSAFIVGLLTGCAYFIFKLVRIWQQRTTTYNHLEKSLTVFDALSLASLISCAVWGGTVWWNFGKGLKQAVLARPGARTFWGGVVGFFSNDSVESLQSKEQDFTTCYQGIVVVNLSIISSNIKGHTKKTTFSSFYYVGYAVGCIVGPQLFLAEEKLLYRTAMRAIAGMYGAYIVLMLLFTYLCWRENNRRDKLAEEGMEEAQPKQAAHLDNQWGVKDLSLRYVL